ncbi:MAG TPA: NADH-quinone oxidoreductase subunit NuoK [Thermoanaerobaculia bacterium]|nr:NADH-quinone oxidoreductase subunit NuoK [Thermoanaerobaculia bacterium]HUM29520.1 NADH-quinone oxidoreductase subunit NuoK [Thermoanaerobaculia bacterium]HXK67903.1 NADH-quinone oxidoreductase subunit NuoK [Thermoanaerobaculia bacterium]
MIVPIQHILILAVALFSIGALGFLTRKSAIHMFLSVEIMLNAGNLAFLGFARQLGDLQGQIFTLFTIAIAAAEAAVGLAIFIVLFRRIKTVNVDRANILRW